MRNYIIFFILLLMLGMVNSEINTNENYGVCQTISLTPEEVRSLWNNYLYAGIRPDQMITGNQNPDGQIPYDRNMGGAPRQINEISKDGTSGAALSLPSLASPVSGSNFEMKETCVGDYSFAFVATDTLRVARCNFASDSNKICSVNTAGLTYRNSDARIEDTFGSSIGLVHALAFGKDKPEDVNVSEYLKEQDYNDTYLSYKAPTRIAGEPIKNHVRTDSFSGEFESVCVGKEASDRCKVAIISFFEKYYSGYYSGIAVSTAVGPMVFGLGESFMKSYAATNKLSTEVGDLAQQAGLGKIVPTIRKKLSDFYYSSFSRDIAAEANVLAGKASGLSTSGSAGIYNQLQGLGGAKSKDAFDGITKLIAELKKNPDDAQAYVQLIRDRIRYMDNVIQSHTLQKEAGQNADELLKLLHRSIQSGPTGVGPKALGDDFAEKFFKDAGNAKYADFQLNVIRDGQIINGKQVFDTKDFAKALDDFIDGDMNPYLKRVQTGPNTFEDMFVVRLKDGKEAVLGAKGAVKTLNAQNLQIKDDIKRIVDGDKGSMYSVFDASGKETRLLDTTFDSVKDGLGTPPYTVYKLGGEGFSPTATLDDAVKNVNDFKATYSKDLSKRLDGQKSNYEMFENSMIAGGLTTKTYINPINKILFDDTIPYASGTVGNLLRFGGVIGYWKLKTSEYSPKVTSYFVAEDEYTNVELSLGQDKVYDNAYFDLFSNESLMNGDFLAKVITAPLEFADLINPTDYELGRYIKSITGIIPRDGVEDLIIWTGTDSCTDCTSFAKLVSGNLNLHTKAVNESKNYALELPKPETYQRDGLSLALFAHHTDIKLKTKDIKKEINIAKAQSSKTTCVDKAKEVKVLGGIDFLTNNPSNVGAVTGAIDSSSLAVLGLVGITPAGLAGLGISIGLSLAVSAWVNKTVTSNFEDCVDDLDGYFVQYSYKLSEKSQEKANSLKDLISLGSSSTQTSSENQDAFSKAMSSVKDKLTQVVEGEDKEFLQFKYMTYGIANSKFETSALFLAHYGGGSYCSPNSLDIESNTTLIDGNNTVNIDKNQGTITINGKEVLRSPLVRTMTRNYRFGALEMAQSATFVPITGESDYFEVNSVGDLRVINQSALMCISSGLAEQSGRSMVGDSMSSIMGRVTEMSTEQGSRITPSVNYFSVIGGSVEREQISGPFTIDRKADLVTNYDNRVVTFGSLDSVIMENGVILHDRYNMQFIVWLRIISQMDGSQIRGLKANLVDTKDPITGCDEQAFDLDVIPVESDVKAVEKGKEMNDALDKVGPFQYFETPDKSFMFYSKQINGECKRYMKIIDKKTGQVLTDEEISSVQKTSDGFAVTTADGATHNFGFSAENGRPMLNYNGERAPLLFAQGRNGSFYYDPKTGKWTVSNSQMLPLDDKFREQGETNIGGKAQPGDNPLYPTSNVVGREGSFDIPIFNENERYYFAIIALVFAAALFIRRR